MSRHGYPELVIRFTRDRNPPVPFPVPLELIARALERALEEVDPHLRITDVIRRSVRDERMSDWK